MTPGQVIMDMTDCEERDREYRERMDGMSWHGEIYHIRTAKGVREIRARVPAGVLIALVRSFEATGDYRAAATEAGVSRRMSHTYLLKLGLIERKLPATHSEYTHAVTGKTIRTLHPFGTVKRAVELYLKQELSTRDVAAAVGVPAYTVWSWMDKLGIARGATLQNRITGARRAGFTSREALRAEIQRLISFGCTEEETARIVGTSRHMVNRLKHGKQRRDPARMRAMRRERRIAEGKPAFAYPPGRGNDRAREARRGKVAEMLSDGLKPLEIAARLEVSVATVYNDMRVIRARRIAA